MQERRLEVILLSKLGKNDGGRETWVYNFLPRLLETHEDLRLTLCGFHPEGAADPTPDLREAFRGSLERFEVRLLPIRANRIPAFFQMLWAVWISSRRPKPAPHAVLGVGGLFEFLLILGGAYRGSQKLIWLRTIFFNEKAGRFPQWSVPLLRKVEAMLLRRAHVTLANGDDIAEDYRARGVDVTVIKNGVDVRRWDRGALPAAPPLHVAFIGRLAKIKGVEEFLESVERIKTSDRADEIVFHVVGEQSEKTKLPSLAERGFLQVHGPVDNEVLPSLLEGIHVCVALTWARSVGGGGGTSNALLEQMAAGKLIVAWDNVIFRQVLDERSAYLVEQGDVDGLSAAFLEIARDLRAASVRASEARRAVLEFSMENQVEKFYRVLSSLSGEGSKGEVSGETNSSLSGVER